LTPSEKPHLNSAALTHPGMTGKNNEDRYGMFSFEADPANGSAPVLFAVVADGVGGKQAGEVAAEIAVEKIRQVVTASDGADPLGTMRRAYLDSNRLILEKAGEGIETSGMATTATCAWIAGDRLYGANIGNSRMYLLRDGALRRLSIDHSWVEEAISHGLITADQARDHPQARVITRHLGSKDPEPDFRLRLSSGEDDAAMAANQGLRLETGDVLLLCSDGLSDVVYDKEIETALNDDALQTALARLTDLANERGGPDNITSIALRVPAQPAPAPKEPPAPTPAPHRRSRLGLYLFSSLVLVVLILVGWLIYLSLFQ
jgi:protein phosphatase